MADYGNAIPGKIYVDEFGVKWVGTEDRRVIRYIPRTIVSSIGINGVDGITTSGRNPVTDSGVITVSGKDIKGGGSGGDAKDLSFLLMGG